MCGSWFSGDKKVGIVLLSLLISPSLWAQSELYVPAYNALVSNFNHRVRAAFSAPYIGPKGLRDKVTQVELNTLRTRVTALMTSSYLLGPSEYNLEVADANAAFPFGLRKNGETLLKPSLMEGIGDDNGLFTKIPGEYTQSGKPIYAASFTDAPLLWVHFVELHQAISKLRYTILAEGVNAGWSSGGTLNKGYGYGAALTSTLYKANCEADYAATRLTENAAPAAITTITAPINWGYLWQAGALQRNSLLSVSGLHTGAGHTLRFYITGMAESPTLRRTVVYDANGTSAREGKWNLWSATGERFEAVVQSAVFGRITPFPAWCDIPELIDGWNAVSWRGYWGVARVVIEWSFRDHEPVPPRFNDPEEDGLADLGCGCSTCPLEACAVWDGLQPQARVVIPLGVSDGSLHAGLRVKAYLTEYELNGCVRQMYSLLTCVAWTVAGDNEWEFVCVVRPSGYEMVFPTKGAKRGQTLNQTRRYRLDKAGDNVTLRFPDGKREIKHVYQANRISQVLVKSGRKEIKTETNHNNGVWPGLTTRLNAGLVSAVETTLLVAKPGYTDNLVTSVEHAYRVAGLTNRVVYYHGSKGFRTLAPDGRVLADIRVVVDPSNGAVEVWSGISTNNGLKVALKERRRSWQDSETNLVMLEQTRLRDDGVQPPQSNVTLIAVETFPWGEEKVSETVAAGTPNAAVTHYAYYADAADRTNYGNLKQVIEAEGAWTEYEYDEAGRKRWVYSGFKNAAAGDRAAARTTEYRYSGDPTLDTLHMPADDSQLAENDDAPRLIIETLAGQEVARTYYSYQTGRDLTVRCAVRGATYDDPSNLVSVTSYYTNGSFLGRTWRVEAPDGTLSTFAYSCPYSQLTTTEESGTGSGGVVTNGVRTVTLTDAGERVLLSAATDIAGAILLSSVTNVLDGLGRVLSASNSVDGTWTRTEFGCCGPEMERDAEGVTTSYVYDELKQVYAAERLGVTRFNQYDVGGRVVETRLCVTGAPDVVTTASYDEAGRQVRAVDARGGVTTWAYASNSVGEQVVTTVFPDGGTQVETSYRDGQPKSVTGTAVRAQCYDYGVDERGTYTTVYEGGDTQAPQWIRTYSDMLGRSWLTVYADGYQVETRYDPAGRPVYVADGLTTRMTGYNAKGEAFRSAVDRDGDAEMDLAGDDYVSETLARVELFQGKPSYKNEQFVYANSGSATASLVAAQWRSLDGATSWSVAFGRTSRVDRIRASESAARRETVLAPDGTRTVSWFTNGLLKSVRQESSTGQVVAEQSYSHDGFGRLARQIETGPGGGVMQTDYRYDSGGNVTGQMVTAGDFFRTTLYLYDAMGRRVRTVRSDGGEVAYDYEPTGELRAQSGSHTYPQQYRYDERGRLTALETFRGGTNMAPDVTRWDYDARRGWQTNKVYADDRAVGQEYRGDGQVFMRIWARGVETIYGYDSAGSLTNIAYSDGTPGVALTLDRLGRPIVVQDAEGVRTNVYGGDGSLTHEILPGSAGELGYEYDVLGRRTNLVIRGEIGVVNRVGYQYDEAGRLLSVAAGDRMVRYGYGGAAGTVTELVATVGGVERLRGTWQYDALGRLERVGWQGEGGLLAGVEYAHNSSDMRSRCAGPDGSYWTYDYDERGQVVAGRKFTVAGVPVVDAQYQYNYDLIGNRNWATEGNGRRLSYRVNEVNQYVEMSIPGLVREAVWSGTVFIFGAGSGGGLSRRAVSRPVEPRYDADGNLTDDGQFNYVWDGENRLILVSNLQSRIAFSYDYQSRRVRKSVYTHTLDSCLLTSDSSFIYDGWNLISEVGTAVPNGPAFTNSFIWGLDLSGTLQGAGGIGGLLFSINHQQSTINHYLHDGNGNITDLIDSHGAPVAHYEYDPFGIVTAMTGLESTNNPFRFNTKYMDDETGLINYGYRYYSPKMGRWISRDPIGEAGGVNVYGFVGNAPISSADPLGLALYAFDGTWNDREKMKRPTNVAKLAAIYDGLVAYRKGVGTDWFSKHVGGITGAGGGNRIEDMYDDLVRIFNTPDPKGENQKIDIIGFSRGAALARTFVNYINTKGGVPVLGSDGKPTDVVCPVKIRFLGLFDTVASFGVPGNDIDWGQNMAIPANVENVRHAVALDEKRGAFPLSSVLSDPQAPSADPHIVEIGFRGAHSDIGGGYEDGDRSNFALMWMRDEAVSVKVPFGPLDPKDVGASWPIIHDERGRFEKWRNKPRVIYYPNAGR